MKKLFVLAVLVLASLPLSAQVKQFTAPDCQFGFIYNVVGGVITSTSSTSAQRLPLSQDASSIVGYDNRVNACTTWTLIYQADSGVTVLSLELDQATSNGDIPGSWSSFANLAPGTVQPLTVTNVGNASYFGYQPWVSVNFNSATGTGRLYGQVIGWKPQAGSDVTAAGNSVIVAGFSSKHISTATNTQIKATPGVLHTIVINGGTAGAVTVVDTSAANCTGGTTLAVIQSAAAGTVPSLTYDVATVNGLCITTAAATDITVSWR